MNEKDKFSVSQLAGLIGRDPSWLAGILTRLGIGIDQDGSISTVLFCQALEQAATLRTRTRSRNDLEDKVEEQTRREMIRLFEKHGLQLLNRGSRYDTMMVFRRSDDTTVRIKTYVALSTRTNKQVGFTVSHLHGKDFDWVCFAARPYNRFFLRSRREIIEHSKGSAVPRFSVSYGPRPHADDFEKRIDDLIGGEKQESFNRR